jgi:hypothetical protein
MKTPSSGMLCRVALVRTDVSEELRAFFIRVTRIGELWTTVSVTSNRRTLRTLVFLRSVRRLSVTASVVPSSPILVTLMKKALSSYETSVLTGITRRNIPEYAILRRIVCWQVSTFRTNLLTHFKVDYTEEWNGSCEMLVPTYQTAMASINCMRNNIPNQVPNPTPSSRGA